MLTKTESSHKTIVVVVMLKESDLMSHTVIGAEAFGCFCQPAQHSDWAGLCSQRKGSCPLERKVKGEVSSWKSSLGEKGQRPAAWDSRAWEINLTILGIFHRREAFLK